MPTTVICLTVEEYQGIMDRLRALEALQDTRMTDLGPVIQRMQGIESTLSAMVATVARLPKSPASGGVKVP